MPVFTRFFRISGSVSVANVPHVGHSKSPNSSISTFAAGEPIVYPCALADSAESATVGMVNTGVGFCVVFHHMKPPAATTMPANATMKPVLPDFGFTCAFTMGRPLRNRAPSGRPGNEMKLGSSGSTATTRQVSHRSQLGSDCDQG